MAREGMIVAATKKAAFAGALAGVGYFATEGVTSLLATKFDAVAKLYAEGGMKEGAAKTLVGAVVTAPAVIWMAKKSRKAAAVLGGLLGVGVLAAAWGETVADKARELTASLTESLGMGGPERRAMRQIAARMEAVMDRGGVDYLSASTGGVEYLADAAGGVEYLSAEREPARAVLGHALL